MQHVPAPVIRAQIESILRAWGMTPELVEITAEVMVETDLAGVDSHGLSMLMLYEEQMRKGQLNLQAKPQVVRDMPAMALIDGQAGLGHPVAAMAVDVAVKKAKEAGIGAVGVFNSHHFGAAGWYAQRAANAGCLGLVFSTARSIVMLPTRGAEPVLGTNPIAFAAPARKEPGLLVDMATTTVAVNKVKVYELNEKPVPTGWVFDGKGQPVTDSTKAMDYLQREPQGGLTPLGGTGVMGSHKGYGLGLMVQVLAGALVGGSFSPLRNRTQKPGEGDNIGHFVIAIDPAAFGDTETFLETMDATLGVCRAIPAADPALPVLVPGDPERASRVERLEKGIPVPPLLAAKIEAISGRAGVPYLFG
ncbi:Ldh family oxidoreductase [Acetobacteraceae bacterium H6797]|nr:Ldh family oxidoreductase [Acetobacteraceae bacterium H6797]